MLQIRLINPIQQANKNVRSNVKVKPTKHAVITELTVAG